MAYTLAFSLDLGQTGLTLSAQLVDTNNANVGSAVSTGFTEIGSGHYLWTYAVFPDGFRGGVKFSAGGVLQGFAAVNPQEVEFADVKTSTRLDSSLSAGITYVGPVAQSGDVSVVQGDDYSNTDSRALEWSTTDATTWPDLTSATITFTVRATSDNTSELTKAGSVVTATGATKRVRVELTAANTDALGIGGAHKFDVQATLSGGRKVTLTRGKVNVLEDQT